MERKRSLVLTLTVFIVFIIMNLILLFLSYRNSDSKFSDIFAVVYFIYLAFVIIYTAFILIRDFKD